jgi:ribonuclease HI
VKEAAVSFLVYADGSCLGPRGIGGYCAVIVAPDGTQRIVTGASEGATTNNIMELMAAIVGLEAIAEPGAIQLRSDSQYVVTGLNERLTLWKANGWRTTNNTPIKNRDLWERLDRAAARHLVEGVWVRGHDGDPMNERADRLARAAAEKEAAR